MRYLASYPALPGSAAFTIYGKEQLAPVCENYLAKLQSGDVANAYTLLTPAARQEQSLEQFEETTSRTLQALGTLESKNITGAQLTSTNQKTSGRITYSTRFQHARATIIFNLEKVSETWQIASVQFDSPAVNTMLTCPSCGSRQSTVVNFCSNCGAAMKPPPPSPVVDTPLETTSSVAAPAEAPPQ